MPLLQFSNVERRYTLGSDTWILGPLSFAIEKEEQVAIMGPSGSGKSTLLHLAGSLDTPSAGEILYKEKNLELMSEHDKNSYRNTEIGFVFQSFHLLPEFSLLENTIMPLIIRGISKKEREEKGYGILAEVGLAGKEKNLPKELSGGERQRAAIARALIHHPQMLLADEPTGNLDAATGKEIVELLIRLQRQKKMTFMIVTHDETIANNMDRRILLADGKILADTKEDSVS